MSNNFRISIFSFFTVALLLIAPVYVSAAATTYTVTNTNDSGAGSLRKAILDANGNAGQDTIQFNIAVSGVQTITPATPLPDLTDNSGAIVDGTTESGFTGTPLIEINGTNLSFGTAGISALSNNNTIRGLVVNRCSIGIALNGTNNLVQGNYVGTNAAGTASLGNIQGVNLNGSSNTVGGTTAAARNVISGNVTYGVAIGASSGNVVEGNLIGTDASGTTALGNVQGGVLIQDATNNTVGGTTAGARNIISGNGAGVVVLENVFTTTGNIIEGNYIGTDISGAAALGNGDGIHIQGADTTTIGGTAAGAGNLISGNNKGIMVINGGTGNTFSENQIYSNSGLGIDLANNGVTGNDVQDPDTGDNNLQNFPVITSALFSAGTTTITGNLNSLPNTLFRIEIFSNTSCDPSGFGEGQTYLGSFTNTTDANGDIPFTVFAAGARPNITTTATNTATGDTSEFSNCFGGPELSVTKSDGVTTTTPGSTLSYTIGYANGGNNGATNVTLSETVPADTTFNSASSTAGWSCSNGDPAGTNCTFNVGTVAQGGTGSVVFAVTVDNAVLAGATQISNTVSISDDGTNGADQNNTNDSATDTDTLTATPDLSLTKSDSGVSTSAGGTVVYTLTITNNGDQGASGIVLTETVPANTTFNSGSSSAGWSCVPDNSAGSTCTLNLTGSIGGGGVEAFLEPFAVTLDSCLPAGLTQIDNTASVADDGSNGADPNPGNNSASDSTPLSAGPDLSITKTDNNQIATPGGPILYTLTVANAVGQDATGVVITETVPVNTTFDPASSTAGWTCLPDNNAGSTCTYTVGALACSASNSVVFAVIVDNPLPANVDAITNTATVADDGSVGPDPNLTDNTAIELTPLNFTGQMVAVDPLGRFVLYTDSLGCVYKVVVYQALNANGNPVGAPRQLSACGVVTQDVTGIDLLKDKSGDQYWISFGGSMPVDSRFLMKIDAFGNIIDPPSAVLSAAAIGSAPGATAIAEKGCCKLLYWTIGNGGSVFRTIVDKTTLLGNGAKKTSIVAAASIGLQSTQRSTTPKFLALESPLDTLKAFVVSAKGLPTGSTWRLSPRTDGGHEIGGVSADGLVALSVNKNAPQQQLYLQKLGSGGAPSGNPTIVATQVMISVDVSNRLTTGTRYVVFVTGNGSVLLQVVDDSTGNKIGGTVGIH